jgi:hypothetical protein
MQTIQVEVASLETGFYKDLDGLAYEGRKPRSVSVAICLKSLIVHVHLTQRDVRIPVGCPEGTSPFIACCHQAI